MQGYFIKSSVVTPSVYFNPNKELLDLRGRSSPENPLKFYDHLLQNIDEYFSHDRDNITVNLAFDYFNTSSCRCIFLVLKKIYLLGKKVTINWYYEKNDHDIKEAGEDFNSIFKYKFNFISLPMISPLD